MNHNKLKVPFNRENAPRSVKFASGTNISSAYCPFKLLCNIPREPETISKYPAVQFKSLTQNELIFMGFLVNYIEIISKMEKYSN